MKRKKLPPNPKKAYGDLKVPLHLVPAALDIGAAISLGEGGEKYGPFNWREDPVEAMTYVGALKRHLAGYVDGEDIDPESTWGKTHLQGLAGCIAILLDATDMGTLIDNRPKKGRAAQRIRELTRKK